MRLSWTLLVATALLAHLDFNFDFAVGEIDRTKLRGAAVSLTENARNNRFLRERSGDDAGRNGKGNFDEERGGLTQLGIERAFARIERFHNTRAMKHIGGLSPVNQERLKAWYTNSQLNKLFRHLYEDGMDPAKMSQAIGLDDMVKRAPGPMLKNEENYVLLTQFTKFWMKERVKAKKLLQPAPSV